MSISKKSVCKNETKKSSLTQEDHDSFYFEGYSDIDIHQEMMNDVKRTETYRQGMKLAKDKIKDKIVLDIGCGCGILSLFAVECGAAKVYAVDASEMSGWAEKVVKSNKLEDKIQVFHGRVEDLTLPGPVDVIVSEWMGYSLLYESMVDCVIYARDKYLNKGGIMIPAFCNLYLTPFTNDDFYEDNIDVWTNRYGYDMSALIPLAKKCLFRLPQVQPMPAQTQLSIRPVKILTFDMHTVSVNDIRSFTSPFKFGCMYTAQFHGFAIWFDVEFWKNSENNSSNDVIVLTTSPDTPTTHWQQTMIYTDDDIEINQDEIIEGTISFTRLEDNFRFLAIGLEYSINGSERKSKKYIME